MKKIKKKKFTRYAALNVITILILGSITSRLIYLQVIKVDYYRETANTKFHRLLEEPAPRGEILDCNNNQLAKNIQSYVVSFVETDDSKQYFLKTMSEIFKVLDEHQQKLKDNFQLKINPYRFEFNAADEKSRQTLELRFKKDRGLNDKLALQKYKMNAKDLNSAQSKIIDAELLKITPEQTFNLLLADYGIPNIKNAQGSYPGIGEIVNEYNVIKPYSLEDERRLMVVKDAIKMKSYSGSKNVIIATDINRDTAFIIDQMGLSGMSVDIQPERVYPYGELASAVIGNISKISSTKYEEQGYDISSDYIGVSGIESAFEDQLKGSKGAKSVEISASGKVLNELASRESYPGQNIKLTIDKDVQYAAERALDKTMIDIQKLGHIGNNVTTNANRGAVVVEDVNTGGIIALVSRPGFDPNAFSLPGGLTTDLWNEYFNIDYEQYGKDKGWDQSKIDLVFPKDKDGNRQDFYDMVPKPLYNYATMSLIPPGSTFKLLMAVAGLDTGAITPYTVVNDQAYFDDGNGFRTDFKEDGPQGRVTLEDAIAVSSNPYFMTVGKNLITGSNGSPDYKKYNTIANYAYKFGLGVDPNNPNANPSTGIEINENFGQVYNTTSSEKNKSTQYLWGIMDMLYKGNNISGNNLYPSIDLYDRTSDSKDVVALKKSIKDAVKSTIISGKYSEAKIEDKLIQLINADKKYEKNKISKAILDKINDNLKDYIIYTAHNDVVAPFNVYNASIGQGEDKFTPLQITNYISTLVNGGIRYKTHLVDNIQDADGSIVMQNKPEILGKTNISEEYIDYIKKGMQKVTTQGTAAGAFTDLPIQTAGKTGSATFGANQNEIGRTSYAFYAGFAPYDNPKIAVCVVIFDGGFGAKSAPVAKAVFESYFRNDPAMKGYQTSDELVAKPTK